MKKIINNLKEFLPNYTAIAYKVELNQDATYCSEELKKLINEVSLKLNVQYTIEDILKINKLLETRDAYKALKKDPSHTRPACETLLRRVLKGKDLYIIGDVVDLGNVLSLETMRAVCVCDYDLISGDIYISKGTKDDSFFGIGRDLINAENLIVYKDEEKVFGSPTSDSEVTKITKNTKNILIMIQCFSHIDLDKDEELLKELYTKYIDILSIEKLEVM